MFSSEIGCFEGIFIFQVKVGSWPYKAPPRRVVYALQESLKEDLDWLQKQQIIVPLAVDETSEWCNSFVLVPKANGKVQLCLETARLNKALMRPVHRGPTLNDILLRLVDVKYLTVTDTSSGYHILNLEEQSSYLTTFSCPFGRYKYI